MIPPSQRGLPPLDLPLNVISVILSLIAKQTITVRERRRLNILLDLKSLCQQHVADNRGHVRRTVSRWLDRGRRMLERLTARAEPFSRGELECLLLTTVKDAYRSGAKPIYTREQQSALISLAVWVCCGFRKNRYFALIFFLHRSFKLRGYIECFDVLTAAKAL